MFGLAASLHSSRHVLHFDIRLSCDVCIVTSAQPAMLPEQRALALPIAEIGYNPAYIHNVHDLSTVPWFCRGSPAFFNCLPPIPIYRDPPTDAVARDLGRESEDGGDDAPHHGTHMHAQL